MQREIKFRAWDAHLRHMIYFENDCMWDTDWLDTCYAMQFTGLHDENGKKIYEGDIMIRDRQWAGKKIGEDLVTVFFYKGQFKFKWHSDKAETYLGNLLKGFKIIGNIYENPELIA